MFPELYPKDKNSNTLWFIKYQTEDFTTGTFKYGKYYGLLNLVADIAEREKLANEYIAIMKRGEALPDCRGKKARSVALGKVAISAQTNFADCIMLCHRYLKHKKHYVHPKTIVQYTGQINAFDAWLTLTKIKNRAIGAIARETCEDFLLYLKDELKLSNTTCNNYKTLFGIIWQQQVDEGRISSNPWRIIKGLPNTKKHLESYPPELRAKIRDQLPAYDPQLWLFMQTIYYCAIRPHCELRLLKIKHLHFDRGLFEIPKELSYSGAVRLVNISEKLLQQFKDAGYHMADAEHYIFTRNGLPGVQQAGINYFKNRWNAFKKVHNIPAVYKLYGSKHTGGKALTQLYNPYITKEHMRHKSIDSTMQYLNNLEVNELKFLQQSYPVF